jgi:putative salt-induced outer membrane protein
MGLVCLSATGGAQAQTPEGLSKSAPVTSGSTDVAEGGFQKAPEAAEQVDATELQVLAGALLSHGNSRTLAATAASKFRLRREDNQLGAAASLNFARSAPTPDEGMQTTAENYQANIRYTRFVSETLAGFVNIAGRRDRFQGLDLRLNIDPGLAYYFIDKEKLRLWAELGYDLQHDVRNQDSIDAATAAAEAAGDELTLDRTETRHNGRAFAGYENNVNAAVTVFSGVEYLQSVTETQFFRLNFDLGISSKIADDFACSTAFGLKYDNEPLPGIEKTDIMTSVNLVYTLL